MCLDDIAKAYGAQKRELTVGQIEDFDDGETLMDFEASTKKERKKEDEIRDGSSLSFPPIPPILLLLREQREELKEIKNILAQIASKLIKTPQKSPQSPANEDDLKAEFEALWKKYPRKQGKKDAYRHFVAARKRNIAIETINNGIDRYNDYIERNEIEPTFIKWGSSWFCEWGWEDDYSGDYRRRDNRRRENLSDADAEIIAREVLYGSQDSH